MVNSEGNGLRHPDLTKSRITNNKDVERLIYMFDNIWFNPFTSEGLDLCNVSTGASPEEDAVTVILTGKE